VPIPKLTALYNRVQTVRDLPEAQVQQIEHFFSHYKDLEPGKWVKVEQWGSPEDAKREILASVKRFEKKSKAK
jgi:inorganic pyrophosphatase